MGVLTPGMAVVAVGTVGLATEAAVLFGLRDVARAGMRGIVHPQAPPAIVRGAGSLALVVLGLLDLIL